MIYFDNAATTWPKPPAVVKAVLEAMTDYGGNPGRGGHALSVRAGEKVYAAREKAASLFGCAAENVVFTKNATEALNIAIKGAYSGGRIIITDLEHNSVRRPVASLAKNGAAVSVVSTSDCDEETLSRLASLCKNGVSMAVFTHVSNVTGRILPVLEMCRAAKACGAVTVVDASQSAGVLPFDLAASDIDFLCAAGHKSLYGPMGTGVLIARRSARTLSEGGSGSQSLSLLMPADPPERFEAGTLNLPGIAGLYEGLSFAAEKSDFFAPHGRALVERCASLLREIKGVRIYSAPPEKNVSMVSFSLEGLPSSAVADLLDKKGFCVRGGLHCSPLAHKKLGTLKDGLVRASFGAFNTLDEVDAFAAAVSEIAK
ncbi:MAG: aminotransferase class V-fold PLP-dependent enzyme [Clostridia bacterium]|nr:aminotransferase class V-fold PLP-dependent enzyme [Clostridia bacterium]